MTTWITSDLHHDHKNIVRFCPESRGHFSSVEEMNQAMIDNINSKVAETDTLIILGDISFGTPERACEFLKALNGSKIIIYGNHDRKLVKSHAYQSQKGLMGIVSEGHYDFINHKFDGKNCNIALFHFPIEEWEGCHHGSYHLHGHQHSPSTQVINSRRMDVGMDSNFMMPYKLDDVLERLQPFKFSKHH